VAQGGQPSCTKLNDALDALILKAYRWGPKDDVLAKLLDLNLELAALDAEAQTVCRGRNNP
jgi:hypothetical protein